MRGRYPYYLTYRTSITTILRTGGNVPPVADAAPRRAGRAVRRWRSTFDGRASHDSDGSVVGYALGLRRRDAVDRRAGRAHLRVRPGRYFPALTVTDDAGRSDTYVMEIVIDPPLAPGVATGPALDVAGAGATLHGAVTPHNQATDLSLRVRDRRLRRAHARRDAGPRGAGGRRRGDAHGTGTRGHLPLPARRRQRHGRHDRSPSGRSSPARRPATATWCWGRRGSSATGGSARRAAAPPWTSGAPAPALCRDRRDAGAARGAVRRPGYVRVVRRRVRRDERDHPGPRRRRARSRAGSNGRRAWRSCAITTRSPGTGWILAFESGGRIACRAGGTNLVSSTTVASIRDGWHHYRADARAATTSGSTSTAAGSSSPRRRPATPRRPRPGTSCATAARPPSTPAGAPTRSPSTTGPSPPPTSASAPASDRPDAGPRHSARAPRPHRRTADDSRAL